MLHLSAGARMNATDLQANRETDKLVAEALGWREVVKPELNGPVDLVGIPPGGEKPVPVPYYSSSTAALLALEDWQGITGRAIEIVVAAEDGDHRFATSVVESDYYYGPTMWLAIAKFLADGELQAFQRRHWIFKGEQGHPV